MYSYYGAEAALSWCRMCPSCPQLSAGFRSAFNGASDGAGLTKLAGGLSSWWGSLDPTPQPVRDEMAERVASSNKVG
jgi:hypothetical protein